MFGKGRGKTFDSVISYYKFKVCELSECPPPHTRLPLSNLLFLFEGNLKFHAFSP